MKCIINEKQERVLMEYLEKKFGGKLNKSLNKFRGVLGCDHADDFEEWLENVVHADEGDKERSIAAFERLQNSDDFEEKLNQGYYHGFTDYLYDKYVLKKSYCWEKDDEYEDEGNPWDEDEDWDDEDEFDDSNEYEDYYSYGNDIWPIMKVKEELSNRWLLNYTSNAEFIAKNGFTEANTRISDLPCTTDVFHPAKVGSEGYNFAYDAEDSGTYYKSLFSYGSLPQYGAVLFQANAIKVYHNADNEDQVIFYNNEAKNIIPLYTEKGKWYVKSVITGKPLHIEKMDNDSNDKYDHYDSMRKIYNRGRREIYHRDEWHTKNLMTLRNLVNWIINNFDQYRKHLVYKNESNVRQNKNKQSIYTKELERNGNNIQRN